MSACIPNIQDICYRLCIACFTEFSDRVGSGRVVGQKFWPGRAGSNSRRDHTAKLNNVSVQHSGLQPDESWLRIHGHRNLVSTINAKHLNEMTTIILVTIVCGRAALQEARILRHEKTGDNVAGYICGADMSVRFLWFILCYALNYICTLRKRGKWRESLGLFLT